MYLWELLGDTLASLENREKIVNTLRSQVIEQGVGERGETLRRQVVMLRTICTRRVHRENQLMVFSKRHDRGRVDLDIVMM